MPLPCPSQNIFFIHNIKKYIRDKEYTASGMYNIVSIITRQPFFLLANTRSNIKPNVKNTTPRSIIEAINPNFNPQGVVE